MEWKRIQSIQCELGMEMCEATELDFSSYLNVLLFGLFQCNLVDCAFVFLRLRFVTDLFVWLCVNPPVQPVAISKIEGGFCCAFFVLLVFCFVLL